MPNDKYCTLEMAKEYCGNVDGHEEDNFIVALIYAASRTVDLETNVYWGPSATFADEVVENVAGRKGYRDTFYTKYAPIISVSLLVDDTMTYVEGTNFEVFAAQGKIQLIQPVAVVSTKSFTLTLGQLKVTYEAGQGAAVAQAGSGKYLSGVPAPPDIQLAVAMIAGDFYKNRERQGILSKTKGAGGDSVSYHEPKKVQIPGLAKAILQRRVRYRF